MDDQLTINIDQASKQIEAILQQVRASSPATSPVRSAIFQKMRQSATVNSRWHIAWPHWPPGLRAKAIAALQKITRRLLQWYIDPIVEQQNQFNQTVINAVQLLADDIATLQISCYPATTVQQAQIDQIQRQLDALSEQMQSKD